MARRSGTPSGPDHTARASAVTVAESPDRQQAAVLEMLRRARGGPVTFARLQEAGIEFPASVVVELELAGIAVARCRVDSGSARPAAAVRLDPNRDPANQPSIGGDDRHPVEPPPAQDGADFAPVVLARARPRPLGARRWAARGALLVLAAILATAGVLGLAGPGSVTHPRPQPHLATLPPSHVGASKDHGTTSAHRPLPKPARVTHIHHPSPRIHRASPPLVSEAEAWRLDLRGHDLLLARDYAAAITALRAAIAATGAHLATCREPTTGTCLIYGYALFDIGRALLLGGDPAAAASVFERRLLINNQLPVVEAALTLARTQAIRPRPRS
jgi:hypothetical protein